MTWQVLLETKEGGKGSKQPFQSKTKQAIIRRIGKMKEF
jgi:hypothetical protein